MDSSQEPTGVRRGWRDFGVHARSPQTLLGKHRIVVAMNDVVGDAGMMRLLLEDGLKNFATFALIRESLVGFRGGDGQSQRMKDGGFAVRGVGSLQLAHFLLEDAGVRCVVLVVLAINSRQSVNVG